MLVLASLAAGVAILWEALMRSQARLKTAVSDLQTVIDLVPVGIAMAEEPSCQYIRVNPLMANMMNVEPGAVPLVPVRNNGQRTNFIFCREGAPVPGGELPVQMAASTGRPTPREELDIVRNNGTTVHVLGEAVPLFDQKGDIRGSVAACLDITDLRAIEAELRNANSVKDEFLALVSHELRTPITVICGNAEVLDARWSRIDDESRATAIHDIRVEGERLSTLVDNLLAVSRLGLLQLDREPLLPRAIVERVVGEHRRLHPERQVDLEGDAPLALGAPVAVERVIENLLSNAEKYSPRDAPINVSLREAESDVEIAVRDAGEGVPSAQLEQLFEPFYRSHAAEHPAGMGIGLTVCKRLVEAQGGQVWASHPVEGGFQVTFTLPLAEDEVAEP
jgi:signal transduction histidine kinase